MITEKAVDIKGNRYWKTIVDPVEYPVTIAEVKDFARIDGNDEDSLLTTFLDAVISSIEEYLGRALVTRTVKMIMDEWNTNEIELPSPPLISVSSVNTVDEDELETEYDSSNYYIITESIPGRLVIKKSSELPSNTERDKAGYNIVFTAGYGDASSIPKKIKLAIMQWVTMIYENRSMSHNDIQYNEPPPEVKKILQTFRVNRI